MDNIIREKERDDKYAIIKEYLQSKSEFIVEVNGQRVHQGRTGFNHKKLNFDKNDEPFEISLNTYDIEICQTDDELIITYTDKIRIY